MCISQILKMSQREKIWETDVESGGGKIIDRGPERTIFDSDIF